MALRTTWAAAGWTRRAHCRVGGARVWAVACVLCAVSAPAQEWTRCLDVRQGTAALAVCFGVHPEATDTLDRGLEKELPPLPPASVLHAGFGGPGLGNGVAVDRRANTDAAHELTLRLAWGSEEPVTLSWSPGDIATATTLARLQDAFDGALGIDVDMAVEGSLVLTRPAITTLVLVFQSRREVRDVEGSRLLLRFATQPSGSVSGQPLTAQPVVVVTDTAGQLVTAFGGAVRLSLIPAQERGTGLSGATAAPVEQGVARFSDLVVRVSRDRGPVRLLAEDGFGGLRAEPDTSADVVLDVVATELRFRTLPDGVVAGYLWPAPVVVATDRHGAVDADFEGRVELSLESSADTLGGVLVATAQRGAATFRIAEFWAASPEPLVRLVAESAGLAAARSDSVWLRIGPAPQVQAPDVVLTEGPPPARPGRWVSVGPHAGGRIHALAAGPQGALYAGTDGAGVYRSADAGATWQPMDRGLVDGVVHQVAAAGDGDRVYAATDSGVYRSADGGQSWVPVLRVPATGIEADPHRSLTVFALARGLRWSRDGGDTWDPVDLERDAAAIAADPAASFLVTGRAVYAVSDTAVAFAHETGLPDDVRAVAVDPTDPRRVYAGTADSLYRSADGGRTWSATIPFGALALAVRDSELYVGNGRGIYLSWDRGDSWTTVATFSNAPTNPQGLTETQITHRVISLAFDQGGALVAGTEEGGVFREISPGRWAASNAGLANVAVPSLVSDPRLPGVVYATGVGRVFKTENGGGSWRVALHAHGRDDIVEGVVISPADPRILVTTGPSPIRVSGDGGWGWTILYPDSLFPPRLAFSPTRPNVLYAGYSYSTDGGMSWSRSLVPPRGVVRDIAVDPDGDALYLGTSEGLFRADARDLDWSPVSGGFPAEADVRALVLDPRRAATLLAGTASGELWRSTDQGDTWTLLGRPARHGQGIGAIAISPEPPGLLYVGTAGAGVFVSADGGTSWEPLSDGLASRVVLALAFDTPNRRLYAGTARAGVFVTALPGSIPSTAVASRSQVSPYPLLIEGAYPNPFNASVRIDFSTDEDGPVTLVVHNAIGQTVRQLVDGELDAGPHTAAWDGADATGRQVATGAYLLRLRARGGERTAKLQLVR